MTCGVKGTQLPLHTFVQVTVIAIRRVHCGPSEQSGTIEVVIEEVGVLNTSQSAHPEDRQMEVLEKRSN